MATTYTLIASSTVGSGGAANIEFTSIPQTYTDLCLKISARCAQAYVNADIHIKFNTSTTGYSWRLLEGSGSSASSNNGTTQRLFTVNGNSATSNTFGSGEAYIPNYTSSNYKSISGDSTMENNATTSYSDLTANLWSNTAAITDITITAPGTTFLQYTTAYLYGISNA